MKSKRLLAIGMSAILVLLQAEYAYAEATENEGAVSETVVENDVVSEIVVDNGFASEDAYFDTISEADEIYTIEDIAVPAAEEGIISGDVPDETLETENGDLVNYGYIPDNYYALSLIGSDGYDYIVYSDEEGDSEVVGSADIASFYDPRQCDYIYLPSSIRNQGDTGTCWVHAVLGAMETELILNDNASRDINLSELQLAYFTSHQVDDPTGGRDGDIVYCDDGNYLKNGGNDNVAIHALTNMIGAVSENLVPFYRGDNYSVPEEYAYNMKEAQLKQVLAIPLTDTYGVKNAILDYGSVTATYYGSSVSKNVTITRNGETNTYYAGYNSQNNAYYSTVPATNHEIMIIGWDDDFSKDNFNASHQPEGDGAWLCRNSWGYQGDSSKGYFWLSYYDVSLNYSSSGSAANKAVYAYDASLDTNDHVYAYDSNPVSHRMLANSTSTITAAQDYYVNGGEVLKSIGIETYNTQLRITATVIANGESVSGSIETSYVGFYTIPLNDVIEMQTAGTVTVKIKLESMVGEVVHIMCEPSESTIYKLKGDGNATYFKSTHNSAANSRTVSTKSETSQNYDFCFKLYTDDLNETYEVIGASANLTDVIEMNFAMHTNRVTPSRLFGISEAEDSESSELDTTSGLYVVVDIASDETGKYINPQTIYLYDAYEEATQNGKEFLFEFSYRVSLKDMNRRIRITLYDKEGNVIKLTDDDLAQVDSYTMCINDYLNAVYNSNSGSMAKLVAALLVYGQAGSYYFGREDAVDGEGNWVAYGTEQLYSENEEDFNQIEQYLNDYRKLLSVYDDEGISYCGSSLVLESETAVRHYFIIEDGYSIDDFRFTVEGQTTTVVGEGPIVYVEISGIEARDYRIYYDLEIESNEELCLKLSYSVLSYACDIVDMESEETEYGQVDEGTAIYQLARMLGVYAKCVNEYMKEAYW